jgi:hypothetical protein
MSTAEPVSAWEAFGKEICRIAFEGRDADGGTIQELGVKHGVLVEEKFDREKHKNVTSSKYSEEGMSVYVFAALSHVQAPACHCTLIEQDESCPVGYPSLLCDDCDGKGHLRPTPHVDEAMVERALPDRDEVIREVVGLCNRIPGSTTWNAAEFMYDALEAAIGGAKP